MNKYLIAGVVGLSLIGYILFLKWQKEKEAHEYAELVIARYAELEKKNAELQKELNNVKDKPSQDWLNTTIPDNIKLLVKQRIQ